ncbi:MAG: hypothetical protein LBR80_11585 [Deltaproteobacteria bacterium]|jgi:hypothetical protein|nr:hypothetical protein [Deltaproteobacteria bacterium]
MASGGGALSLGMRLSGHGSVRGALAEICRAFGEDAADGALAPALFRVAGATAPLGKALARPPLPLDTCESLWPGAREYQKNARVGTCPKRGSKTKGHRSV